VYKIDIVERQLISYEQGKEVQQALSAAAGSAPVWHTQLARFAVEAMAVLAVPTLVGLLRESASRVVALDTLGLTAAVAIPELVVSG
jgi:hypothetical protein